MLKCKFLGILEIHLWAVNLESEKRDLSKLKIPNFSNRNPVSIPQEINWHH